MPNVIVSPNMNLQIPVVGTDPGPDWANNLNSSLTVIDGHNHTPGLGVRVPTDGIDIDADLTFNGFNALSLRSTRYSAQMSPLSLPSDLGCVYVSGVDLYYNDTSGNQVRITEGGSVAGTPGSITGLVPPASVTYTPSDQTFTFSSAANTPANGDFENIILRNFVASSKGLTLMPPAAMAADYDVTLPALPGTKSIVTMTTAGALNADLTTDNTTINVTANQLVVQAAGLITGPGLTTSGNRIELTTSVSDNVQFLANGIYSAATFPQTQIDGYFIFPYNATITSIWIFNQIQGVNDTTEFDLKKATSGGSFTTILSTTGKITSSAVANVWTDNGAIIAPQTGVTKPVLSTTSVNAGDALRFDLLQSMGLPAADCGLIVYFVPR